MWIHRVGKGKSREARLQSIFHRGMMGDYLLLERPSGLNCKLIWRLVRIGFTGVVVFLSMIVFFTTTTWIWLDTLQVCKKWLLYISAQTLIILYYHAFLGFFVYPYYFIPFCRYFIQYILYKVVQFSETALWDGDNTHRGVPNVQMTVRSCLSVKSTSIRFHFLPTHWFKCSELSLIWKHPALWAEACNCILPL